MHGRYKEKFIIDEKRCFMWEEEVSEVFMIYVKLALFTDLFPPFYSWKATDA
jgi:hypothetical protein